MFSSFLSGGASTLSALLPLTLSFLSGIEDEVVLHGRAVVGKRELQLELVEEVGTGDGGVRHEGCVPKLIYPTEAGTGDVDG